MAENNETVENQTVAEVTNEPETTVEPTEPQTFTAEQVEEIKKEWQTKGFVAGKKETNAKWEKTIAEKEAAAKKQAELDEVRRRREMHEHCLDIPPRRPTSRHWPARHHLQKPNHFRRGTHGDQPRQRPREHKRPI